MVTGHTRTVSSTTTNASMTMFGRFSWFRRRRSEPGPNIGSDERKKKRQGRRRNVSNQIKIEPGESFLLQNLVPVKDRIYRDAVAKAVPPIEGCRYRCTRVIRLNKSQGGLKRSKGSEISIHSYELPTLIQHLFPADQCVVYRLVPQTCPTRDQLAHPIYLSNDGYIVHTLIGGWTTSLYCYYRIGR